MPYIQVPSNRLVFAIMVNDVGLELRMNFLVSKALIILDECSKFICLLMWHLYLRNFIRLFIIEVNYFIFISLIFNGHVMKNYASFHYVLECFREEKSCKSTYNCESCLKHSKCMLYILPIHLLGFCK